jgi:ATPase family associated with various cellular activities (AAA)
MTCYVKEDNIFWPTPNGAIDIRETLPVGTYTVGKSMKGFYLKAVENFHMAGKIYGKTPQHADRILNTFDARPNATGVLLTGEKGSGKTMLAKIISRQAADKGMPTIIINDSFSGDDFNSFIQSIDTPSVVIFDEFEKVFTPEDQEGILTLLDGVYPTKKLFILTTNDKYRVNQHLTNRPGRIFYMIEYKGIDLQFIEEYCNDNLNNKSHIQQICRLTMMYPVFNFDMLKALVEEMNRYNETPNEALEILNAKPFMDDNTRYDVKVAMDGKPVDADLVSPCSIRGNPITNDDLSFYIDGGNPDSNKDDISVDLTQHHLKQIDPDGGTFTYVLETADKSFVVTFTKESFKTSYRWQDAI